MIILRPTKMLAKRLTLAVAPQEIVPSKPSENTTTATAAAMCTFREDISPSVLR